MDRSKQFWTSVWFFWAATIIFLPPFHPFLLILIWSPLTPKLQWGGMWGSSHPGLETSSALVLVSSISNWVWLVQLASYIQEEICMSQLQQRVKIMISWRLMDDRCCSACDRCCTQDTLLRVIQVLGQRRRMSRGKINQFLRCLVLYELHPYIYTLTICRNILRYARGGWLNADMCCTSHKSSVFSLSISSAFT